MGSLQSSPTQSYQRANHPRFGSVYLDSSLKNEYHCRTIQIMNNVIHYDVVDKWLKQQLKNFLPELQIKQIANSYSQIIFQPSSQQRYHQLESFLLPIKFKWQSSNLLCGKSGILKIQYEAFMFNLQNQIKNRINQKKYFLQTQIWFLLYKIVQLAKCFQDKSINVGNVCTRNILINQDGQVRILTQLSYPQFLCSSTESLNQHPSHSHSFHYLQKNIPQTFFIGLTILCAGSLSLQQNFYYYNQYNIYSISYSQVITKMKSLKQHYSTFLYSILETMLIPNLENYFASSSNNLTNKQSTNLSTHNISQKRTSTQIYYALRLYQDDILQLYPFLPNIIQIKQIRSQLKQQRRLNEKHFDNLRNKANLSAIQPNLPNLQHKQSCKDIIAYKISNANNNSRTSPYNNRQSTQTVNSNNHQFKYNYQNGTSSKDKYQKFDERFKQKVSQQRRLNHFYKKFTL